MDFEIVDIIRRSRLTLLEILEAKGYDITRYKKFGPFEIETMMTGDKEKTLRMDLERVLEEGIQAPTKCRVEYAIPKVKNRLAGFLSRLLDTEDGDPVDPKTTEIVVITLESIGDSFTTAALSLWNTQNLRIAFFDAHTLVSNPLNHVLVPKHEMLPSSEHAEFLKKYHLKTKMNLPMIRFHEDIIARILGLVPGDIVKITRPSPQSGEYIHYRICVG